MACPWFSPVSEVDFSSRPRPARAPLGSVFHGSCEAHPDAPFTPSDDLLFGPCNFGYGRDRCPAFPADSEGDAVRFTKLGNRSVWILEREHSPVRHGSVDDPFPSARLERQAQAFTQACLNKQS